MTLGHIVEKNHMDESSLFNIYGNITRTMMEFHNELIKIFNLVGGCGWGGSAGTG